MVRRSPTRLPTHVQPSPPSRIASFEGDAGTSGTDAYSCPPCTCPRLGGCTTGVGSTCWDLGEWACCGENTAWIRRNSLAGGLTRTHAGVTTCFRTNRCSRTTSRNSVRRRANQCRRMKRITTAHARTRAPISRRSRAARCAARILAMLCRYTVWCTSATNARRT